MYYIRRGVIFDVELQEPMKNWTKGVG